MTYLIAVVAGFVITVSEPMKVGDCHDAAYGETVATIETLRSTVPISVRGKARATSHVCVTRDTAPKPGEAFKQ